MTITVTVPTTMSYDGTVHTYTDDSDPVTGMDGGGHVERMIPCVKDIVSVADYVISQTASADASALLSSQWATLTTGLVSAIDYSSKAWAIGGTGVDTIGGSAKDWATKLTTVGNTELYGAKKYADDAEQSAIDATNNGAAQVTLAAAQVTLATNKYIQFDNRYLGVKTSDPTLDNYGDALVSGATYFNSAVSFMKVWNGSAWLLTYLPAGAYLIASNNLSDLTDKATAINNLGCLKKALFFAAN